MPAAPFHPPFAIPAKPWFRIAEAGAVLGMSKRFIEEQYDRGALSGMRHNAATGKRMTKRISHAWLLAYAERTADYDDEALCTALLAALHRLPGATLQRLADKAENLAARV